MSNLDMMVEELSDENAKYHACLVYNQMNDVPSDIGAFLIVYSGSNEPDPYWFTKLLRYFDTTDL